MNKVEQQRYSLSLKAPQKRLRSLLRSKTLTDLDPGRCSITYPLVTLEKLPILQKPHFSQQWQ